MSSDGSGSTDEVHVAVNPTDGPARIGDRPPASATKDDLRAYAVRLGASREALAGQLAHWDGDRGEYVGQDPTKDELNELIDRLGG